MISAISASVFCRPKEKRSVLPENYRWFDGPTVHNVNRAGHYP